MVLQKRKLPNKIIQNIIESNDDDNATKYSKDGNYRKSIKNINRDIYRNKHNIHPSFCISKGNTLLAQLLENREVALVNRNLKIMTLPVVTSAQCAMVLDVHSSTIFRWVNNQMLPAPVLLTKKKSGGAYLDIEMRIFIEVIGKHLTEYLRYRESNKDVAEELHFRINELRQTQKI